VQGNLFVAVQEEYRSNRPTRGKVVPVNLEKDEHSDTSTGKEK
jgi:hypothetical protein